MSVMDTALRESLKARRETDAIQRHLKRARFEKQGTLEEFDFTVSETARRPDPRLGALRWLHAGESAILFGRVGTGKSHTSPRPLAKPQSRPG
ncbi:ATP-binding protein [Streptomyces shenzhenensis]